LPVFMTTDLVIGGTASAHCFVADRLRHVASQRVG